VPTDEQRVAEIMAALIAEFGEPNVWDEETAMRFARYAYGQGYTDAQTKAVA
jgi:hypothetical protein